MARRASAGAIIAGLIARSRHREERVEQTSLLQSKEHGIGAKLRAESARAELVVGFARIVGPDGLSDFALRPAAAFEHAQNVARLRNFPALERSDLRQDALPPRFFRSRRGNRSNGLRRAVASITFAEPRILVGIAAVVVERCAPEQASGRHHAR